MTRTLLAALALVFALASPSHAQTTRVQLSTTAWTDICIAPCSVKAINGTALFIIDTTPPTSLTQSPIPWNPENGLLPNMVTGAHVYGLAQSGNTAVSSIPSVASGGGSGGGGGGGPVTVADGADTTQGAKADTQATDDTSSWSVVAILKRISAALRGTLTVNGSGVTQPVSATSLPLPTGAATAANQNSTAAGTSSTTANGVQGVTGGVPLPVSGTFYQTTQPVSATSLPLPTGAATAANQVTMAANQNSTAAGTSATNAQGVQGVTNGVPLPIQGGNATSVKTAIDQTTPGTTNGVQVTNQPTSTTTGALQPPTAAAGKITQTQVSVAAATSTQLVAANANRIAVEIQCDGTAPVGIDRTGGALASATAAPLVIPSGAYPLYPMPVATLTAITAYTATAQSCRVTEYLR